MMPMTASDVARIYKTTTSYVYRLACTHKWRRIRHNGSVYYHAEDVDKSLGK